jgi:hypothetical protein
MEEDSVMRLIQICIDKLKGFVSRLYHANFQEIFDPIADIFIKYGESIASTIFENKECLTKIAFSSLRMLSLSFIVIFTLCKCDTELVRQRILSPFSKINEKSQKIGKLYENLHQVYFCQIVLGIQEISTCQFEKKVFFM